MNTTNGFVVCRKDVSNHFSFVLYKTDALLSYGFDTKKDSLSAPSVKHWIDYFNYSRFGLSTCKLLDTRLLGSEEDIRNMATYDKNYLTGKIKFKAENGELATLSSTGRTSPAQPNSGVPACTTITTETDWWYNPNGDACNCDGDEYYVYTEYHTEMLCSSGGTSPDPAIHWWQGSSGGGGGGGTGTAPPKDSNYYKSLLTNLTLATMKTSDSIFSLAQTKKVEYTCIITRKIDTTYPGGIITDIGRKIDTTYNSRNVKTDNKPNTVRTNYAISNGETLAGEIHTHQDDNSTLPQQRSSVDMPDVLALSANGNETKQDFVSIVEIGDIRQALVIEDTKKAVNFISHLNQRILYYNYVNKAMSFYTGNNWRQATLNATLQMLGSSSSSGIGVYQTTSSRKFYYKLN